MTWEQQIRIDAESALTDISRLKEEIKSFEHMHEIESHLKEIDLPILKDLNEFHNRVFYLLDRIEGLLDEIREVPISDRPSSTTLSLSTLAQELKSHLEWLEGILSYLDNLIISNSPLLPQHTRQSISGPVRGALSKIKSYLLPQLKKFLSKLWTIISGLLTPKEWKIKGQVGTGPFGLANVEIELTFGP